jgi:hypothetical protein
MKRDSIGASILTVMALLLIGSQGAQAQVGSAGITTVQTGSNFDVSVFVQRIGAAAWNMGTCSFVFNYNTSALTFDSILTKGRWDASASALYSPLFSAAYGVGTAQSIETDNATTGLGTDVPQSATLVATLRFRIKDFSVKSNISWNTPFSAFFDATGLSQTLVLTAPVDHPFLTGVAGVTQPAVYSLSQNFPNPFNPSTQISFATTKAGPVSLRVYDVLGREVATLVNEYRQPGQFTERFDGSRMASGVYIVMLKTGEGQRSNRMVLAK